MVSFINLFHYFSLSYTVVYTFKFAMKMNALYTTSFLLECLKHSPKSNKQNECTVVVNDTAFVYKRDPDGSVVLQHAPSPKLFKLNTDFKFMCFCGFWNQVKADKTHFVAPRREGEFGLYLVCRTVHIVQMCR